MRIIGEFDKGPIKITALQMNGKISIKFELNLLEQTYKFRDGSGIERLIDVENFCDDELINEVHRTFDTMSVSRLATLERMNSLSGTEFDIIL